MADPSTLDRNIEIRSSQSEKVSDNVRDILEELNGEMFADNSEDEDSGGRVGATNLDATIRENLNRVSGLTILHHVTCCVYGFMNFKNFDVDDDPEIEAKLGKISFTAAERNTSNRSKVIILENIKLRSLNGGEDPDKLIDSSDEEIIETTPQKKKSTSMDRYESKNSQIEILT